MYYITATLEEENIDSKDIDFRQLRHNTVENIGNNIIDIGQKCRESGLSKLIISTVLVKNNINITKFIRQLNDILRNLCLVNDFYFISKDNITRVFICQDGAHLNKYGCMYPSRTFCRFCKCCK